MADSYTETKINSRTSRFIKSIVGAVIGLLMFFGSFALLWWNEGRTLHRYQALDETKAIVVSIAPELALQSHDQKVIHTSGFATTNETLKDNIFFISKNALKLKRTVQMYQWEETKRNDTYRNADGTETEEVHFNYDKVWSESLIDSRHFKYDVGHTNPKTFPLYKTNVFVASKITIGDITLNRDFVSKIDEYSIITLTNENFKNLSSQLQSKFNLANNEFYQGNIEQPAVGDVRVSFASILPQDISVIGLLSQNQLIPYHSKNGAVALLESGKVDADTMINHAVHENMLIGWALRTGGFLLMWIGLCFIIGPIVMLLDIIPYIGGIASSILNLGVGITTFLISSALSIATIASAWFYYRPLLAGGLFATSVAIATIYFMMAKRMEPKRTQGSLRYAEKRANGASDGI